MDDTKTNITAPSSNDPNDSNELLVLRYVLIGLVILGFVVCAPIGYLFFGVYTVFRPPISQVAPPVAPITQPVPDYPSEEGTRGTPCKYISPDGSSMLGIVEAMPGDTKLWCMSSLGEYFEIEK